MVTKHLVHKCLDGDPHRPGCSRVMSAHALSGNLIRWFMRIEANCRNHHALKDCEQRRDYDSVFASSVDIDALRKK